MKNGVNCGDKLGIFCEIEYEYNFKFLIFKKTFKKTN